MKKLRNSENLDCAIISLFYPNGRLNQASQGNWDNMPQALGRAELGYAMAHGRVILHRQRENYPEKPEDSIPRLRYDR